MLFDDFGSIVVPIFVVFRGCIAHATRLAARRAEPLFLLAGALLRSVYTFSDKPEKRQKSTENRSERPARTSRANKTRFFRFRSRVGVDFHCLGALPDAAGHRKSVSFFLPGRFGGLSGCSWDAPGRSQGASGSLWIIPGSSLSASGCPRTLRTAILGGFWVRRRPPSGHFASIVDALGAARPSQPGRSALWRLDRPAPIDLCRSTSQNETSNKKNID